MKRLFGTDGIRGVAGEFPLDGATVEAIGRALARTLASAAGHAARVVLGSDTRESGPAIEAALVRGLAGVGGRADRGGVLTTPAVACVTRQLGYDAGIVVSASHNPYRDNGIKVFSREGFKLPDAVEAAVERIVLDGDPGEAGRGAAAEPPGAGAAGPPRSGPEELDRRYLDTLLRAAGGGRPLAGMRIALDCANGAACALGPDLFRRAGAEVIALNTSPDGRNINEACGALHPGGLSAEVVRAGAALGLAFDGDADRCITVDASGRVLDGDHVLFLAARDLRRAGRLPGGRIVGTVMSNLWLERALAAEGIGLLRAPVGDKYVLEEMQRQGIALGGEQSGHIIFLETATTGDGLLTGLLVASLLRRTGLDLAAWAATIRPFPQVLVNVPVRARPPLETHPVLGPAIRAEEEKVRGLGRVLVRYSGTEAKARIMVEGESAALVEETARRLQEIIKREIGRDSA
jgi:phosphoglucosamine mutase